MLKNLGIVQACFHSPRFRCNAVRKLGGRSLLEWVIRRVTDSMRLDGVIVVACETEDVLRRQPPGAQRRARLLRRRRRCAWPASPRRWNSIRPKGVVRIRGDNLFIDPGLIDRLVTTAEAHPNCDYVSYCSRDGRPAILSPVSVYAEWFRASALRKANRLARDPARSRARDPLPLLASREVQSAADSRPRRRSTARTCV